MNSESIEVTTDSGQTMRVVVLRKREDSIQVVLGGGVNSMKCELVPTRAETAYVGSIRGREIVYARTRAQVREDLARSQPGVRPSRPR